MSKKPRSISLPWKTVFCSFLSGQWRNTIKWNDMNFEPSARMKWNRALPLSWRAFRRMRRAEKSMRERVQYAPELFLAAVDKETGKIAGTLNGLATNETKFRDAFFDEISLYDPKGENVMLLGLSVLPEYRGQGIARALMEEYSRREQKNGRKQLILTCLQDKVEMYKKMNFRDEGISASTWGGEEWHDMTRKLND